MSQQIYTYYKWGDRSTVKFDPEINKIQSTDNQDCFCIGFPAFDDYQYGKQDR